ncbi:TBC1 domain family member 15-like isoform X1 [Osmerus mordax]|uniref:TBC1 domain family member 15-like isoform X1 n=1 Tax=Osmerus mordax TaxID=8014 RepID=UPI0035106B63
MATSANFKVVFEKEGVFMHTDPEIIDGQDSLTSGRLQVIDKSGEVVVELNPEEDHTPSSRKLETQLSCEAEWDLLNAVYYRKSPEPCSTETGVPKQAFCFSLSVLDSIRVKEEGWSYLELTLKDYNKTAPKNHSSQTHTLHFHQGGCQAFLDTLRRYVALIPSPSDESRLQVKSHGAAMAQSFENLLDDATFGLLQKFKEDPITATMGGLSKVTHYLFDAFKGPDTELHEGPAEELFQGLDAELQQGPARGSSDLLSDHLPGLDFNQQEEPGFEVITRVDLSSRPRVLRRDPVTEEEWSVYMDQQGRLTDVDKLKHGIFRGGLSPGMRKEGWRFLLGYFPWDSTLEERTSLTRRKTDEYFRMKLQWRSVSEKQQRRNTRLRDHRNQIEKDVNRTDRTHRFYEGDQENPGLILLHDILMTYCMYDFDLGYVQGMSDLLSPILYVMENEVEAFWCFISYMQQLHHNFEEQMHGMKTQLSQLGTLLRLLDPTFWNYLEAEDSGYLYFCFRWLLIRFKREFIFCDVLRLWEVMWTGLPCQNFHLLVCCAILDAEKHTIMNEGYGFNDILKHINDLAMKLDLEVVLARAEVFYEQLSTCEDISVVEILGLDKEPESTELVHTPRPPEAQTPGTGGTEVPEPSQSTELGFPEPSTEQQDPVADRTPDSSTPLREAGRDIYKLAYIS